MFNRLLYPWNLPPYGLPNTQAFDWKPANLEAETLHLPEQVREMVESVQFDWMFDYSCALARQLRRIGISDATDTAPSGAVFIASENAAPSLVTSAHAFITSLAQRAALEMSGLMMEHTQPPQKTSDNCTIAGIAFLAETARHRGAGARLSATLHHISAEVARRCADRETWFAQPCVQFMHCQPAQARSPIADHGVIPVAGYKITFTGCRTGDVLQALGDAVRSLPPAERAGERTDVLVLSNLWTPAEV